MKIVFFNKLNRVWLKEIEKLRHEFPDVDFVTEKRGVEGEIRTADALVAAVIQPEVLKDAKDLKIIFVPMAGVDALPLDFIRVHHIRVSNVHGNAPYVAERAIAMTLSFFGKICEYHTDLTNSQWHGLWGKGGLADTWDSIQGRTCAVIGTGRIGRYIARFLKAFECRVVGFKKKPVSEQIEFFDEGTTNLRSALNQSELVFVTLPLTDETREMFNAEILATMKGKFLVNVGRGHVVEEEGLYHALKTGILKGAAIDTWYTYPGKGKHHVSPSRYPIHELPNVILSPHTAGFTPQSARLNIVQTFENIRSFIQTGKARFEMDPDLTY